MGTEELRSEHLARLHERAAELDVPNFRRLSREKLIEEIVSRGGGEAPAPEAEAGPPEPRRRPRREKRSEPQEAEGEPASGVLDVVPAGHGFLRLQGLEPGPDDVYISASQIRRCELRAGDEVAGPARQARRGERHPALVRVERVNGEEPGAERAANFDELTPVMPRRRIPLQPDPDAILARAAD
ncbi:MAG: transcription termination factor Rho, partial [Solirubrobacterales bacterium]